MATIEIEVWADGVEDDFAHLLAELENDVAIELYRHLWREAHQWCDDRNENPEVYRRTTGRHVKLADLLQWYEQEGMLGKIEVNGRTAFTLNDEVQEAVGQTAQPSALVRVDND